MFRYHSVNRLIHRFRRSFLLNDNFEKKRFKEDIDRVVSKHDCPINPSNLAVLGQFDGGFFNLVGSVYKSVSISSFV
jgi:hypothetical protein